MPLAAACNSPHCLLPALPVVCIAQEGVNIHHLIYVNRKSLIHVFGGNLLNFNIQPLAHRKHSVNTC